MKRLLIAIGLAACVSAALSAQSVTMDASSSLLQTMDGFGAADLFLGALSDAQADQFFSQSAGIGLSILRTGIDPTGATMSAYSNIVKAAARGAKIFAVPLTAPAAYKDNSSLTNGGNLLVADYTNWANIIAGFQATVVANGGPNLYGIEVQNEPDEGLYNGSTPTYNSMWFTYAAMPGFIDVLGPKLAALTPPPLLMAPTSANWDDVAGYTTQIAADSTATSYTGLLATHQYAGTPVQDSHLPSLRIWETEMSYFNAFDATMTSAITMATDIHSALTNAKATAWCYWWLLGQNADNEGLVGYSGNTTITKRYYALGNWSKFVRPGWIRMTTNTTSVPSGMLITAFKSPTNQNLDIVVVNNSGSSVTLTATVSNMAMSTVTPYVTSATQNLAAQSPITLSGGSFSATIPDQTVTTFDGFQAGGLKRLRGYRVK
jgi:glucuronoarabinoxylan endo-1,4-beta-xylanase